MTVATAAVLAVFVVVLMVVFVVVPVGMPAAAGFGLRLVMGVVVCMPAAAGFGLRLVMGVVVCMPAAAGFNSLRLPMGMAAATRLAVLVVVFVVMLVGLPAAAGFIVLMHRVPPLS